MTGAAGPLERYRPLAGTFDEIFAGVGTPRAEFREAVAALGARVTGDFGRHQALADVALLQQGVTFSVYSDARGGEKILPFCLLPRLVSAHDWEHVQRGLAQRIAALEAFLADVYGEQRILAERRIPAELVLGAKGYQPKLRGIRPPGGVRIHIAGIDLVRDPAGTFRVLEDNLRCPSGVSYVLENRSLSKRLLPEALHGARVRRVDQYPSQLADALRSVSPVGSDEA
ncbi:MAG: circularly permuted type 2 ATP-grasp protein, partial [Anaeromyxobacteraceae bacterium]